MRQHGLHSLVLRVFILSLVGVIAIAHADNTGVRNVIQAQYNRWSTAYIKNDVPTLLSILSPDFTLQTGSGKVLTRQQYEAILKKRKPKTPEQMRYTLVIERFQVRGNIATLYTRETQSETNLAAKPHSAPPEKHIHEYLDRWTRSGDSWRLQFSQTLKEAKEATQPMTKSAPEKTNKN